MNEKIKAIAYKEEEFNKISKRFQTPSVTKVIIEPSNLWIRGADSHVLMILERALFRVARHYGFTKAISEETMDGMKRITFVKPSDEEFSIAKTY